MIGPDASAIARLTVATSSTSDVRGSCTAVTEWPLAARSGITFAQLDPSAQAPWTRTTSDDFAISPSPRYLLVRGPRVLVVNARAYVEVAAFSAIRGTPAQQRKRCTRWPKRWHQ